MKKKVLITGASGFVGYHLIAEALNSGLEVYAAIRPGSTIEHLKEFNIQYVVLDFSTIERLKKEIEEKRYNYIIHAAGTTKAKTKQEYNKVNAEYTKNLALAASTVNTSVEKFIFVSSLAAVGPLTNLSEQIEDNSENRPVTNYGASKLLAEQYLAEIPGLPLIIIRPTAVYGPREKDIFILFKSIDKGLEPYIGDFDQQLSFVYVKDLARIIIAALESKIEYGKYNVSDGEIYDRYALANVAKQVLHKKTWKFHLPVSTVNILASFMDLIYTNSKDTPTLNKEKMNELTAINWACSIKNIKKDLGYTPKYNLENGLTETLKWYKNNNWL